MHPQCGGDVLSQMGCYSDMALPPAFPDGPDGFGMGLPPAFDGQEPMFPFGVGVPAMMYNPAADAFETCGWCMPMDALQQHGPNGEGECGGMPNGEMPTMKGLMEDIGGNYDGDGPQDGQQWSPEQGMPLDGPPCPMPEGLPEGWTENGMPMDQPGPMMDMMQDSHGWGQDGGMPMDQGCPMGDMDGQGWSGEGSLPMEQGGMLDGMQD